MCCFGPQCTARSVLAHTVHTPITRTTNTLHMCVKVVPSGHAARSSSQIASADCVERPVVGSGDGTMWDGLEVDEAMVERGHMAKRT